MAKIKSLSGNPADFHVPVVMKELDGKTDAEFIFTCKGRTLRDWHPMAVKRMADDANAMLDAAEAQKAAEEKDAEETAPAKKTKAKSARIKVTEADANKAIDEGLKRMVEIVRAVATGWDLDDEFSDENIEQACSMYPGIHQELWRKYDERIRGNRSGN